MPLFVSKYIAVLDTVKQRVKEALLKHLRGLMADAAIYGWQAARAYHVVWLQQLENGPADWDETECKLEFR